MRSGWLCKIKWWALTVPHERPALSASTAATIDAVWKTKASPIAVAACHHTPTFSTDIFMLFGAHLANLIWCQSRHDDGRWLLTGTLSKTRSSPRSNASRTAAAMPLFSTWSGVRLMDSHGALPNAVACWDVTRSWQSHSESKAGMAASQTSSMTTRSRGLPRKQLRKALAASAGVEKGCAVPVVLRSSAHFFNTRSLPAKDSQSNECFRAVGLLTSDDEHS